MILSGIENPGGRYLPPFEIERRAHADMQLVGVAADIVRNCALAIHQRGDDLRDFRADFNLNGGALPSGINGTWKLNFNLVGQAVLPPHVNLSEIAHGALVSRLGRDRLFDYGDFSPDRLDVNLTVNAQSPNIAGIAHHNRWGDSAVVHGYALDDSYGQDGTFAELILGRRIDDLLRTEQRNGVPQLRSDGKIHIRSRYGQEGVTIEQVNVTTAHASDIPDNFYRQVGSVVEDGVQRWGRYGNPQVLINSPGGPFVVHSYAADAGNSKKDHPLNSGGQLANGTEGRYGKDGTKAAPNLAIGTRYFANLTRQASGAHFVSIVGASTYGSDGNTGEVNFMLGEIDPELEYLRLAIDSALLQLPHDRDGVAELVGIDWASIGAFLAYNDPFGFYDPDKPWNQVAGDTLIEFRRKILATEI